MDGEKLRDGIFALRTRRFGSVAEYMVKRLLKCAIGRTLFHDLYDDALNHRIEVKFSVVQKKAERTITERTVIQCIEESTAEERMVAFADWKKHLFLRSSLLRSLRRLKDVRIHCTGNIYFR